MKSHSEQEIADKTPKALRGADDALYVEALKGSRAMFSVDGMMTSDGAASVLQVLETSMPKVRNGVIDRGQRATIITERAVFEVAAEGLMLTEIAKGVDVKKDILEQMEFGVRVVDQPKVMDEALFAQ